MSARAKNKKDAKFKCGDIIKDNNDDAHMYIVTVTSTSYWLYEMQDPLTLIEPYTKSDIETHCHLVSRV